MDRLAASWEGSFAVPCVRLLVHAWLLLRGSCAHHLCEQAIIGGWWACIVHAQDLEAWHRSLQSCVSQAHGDAGSQSHASQACWSVRVQVAFPVRPSPSSTLARHAHELCITFD